MPSSTTVAITPKVLGWAIGESGLSREEVAARIKVPLSQLIAYEKGDDQPSLGEFRSIARVLKRQTAVFMLPEPPRSSLPALEFRGPPGELRPSLNSDERKFVRQVARMQRALAWVIAESGELADSSLPIGTQGQAPEASAALVRARLAVTPNEQIEWKSTYLGFRAWREALERCGVTVFLLPLGDEAARGLSLSHPTAPALIVNSAWNVQARIFTMFHEVGHLVLRTSSVCVGYVGAGEDTQRNIERWCDRFAAALLMPEDVIRDVLQLEFGSTRPRVSDLIIPTRLAHRLKVSLRAAVLRLVDLGFAPRSLYTRIPVASDRKYGGGGGKGRTRVEAREDQFGGGARKAFARAVREELMTRADALTFLDIADEDFAVDLSG